MSRMEERARGMAAPPRYVPHPGKRDRSYVPSYAWGAATLGDRHERIADSVWDVPGWLTRDDAMKLYELAYFSRGPILEIGTYCGRSAIVMATAIQDAGGDHCVISVDIDPAAALLAHRYVQAHGVGDHVVLVCQTAQRLLSAVPVLRPDLVFVDADHERDAVRADLDAIRSHVEPGALIVLHDYLPMEVPDSTGFSVSAEPIEVQEAAAGSWIGSHAEFGGTFGACGLFRVVNPSS